MSLDKRELKRIQARESQSQAGVKFVYVHKANGEALFRRVPLLFTGSD